MRIDFGFQSTCSELVTHLGITKEDKVWEAMRTIAEVTGWTWGARLPYAVAPIPKDRIKDIVRFIKYSRGEEEFYSISLDRKEIESLWGKDLDEVSRKALRNPRYSLHTVLYEGSEDRIAKGIPSAEFTASGYSESPGPKGLSIRLLHHAEVHMFPVFHQIRKIFESDLTGEDGGTPETFAQWLAYHFLDRERVIAAITRYERYWEEADKDWREEAKRMIDTCKKHPPIDKRKGLTEHELEIINYRFLDEYGKEDD